MTETVPARLLVVDDETALMRSLCETLHDQGYEVEGHVNGADALAALGERSFDILLADLAMPHMDGISLLREALKIDGSLVCIIMTGEGTISSAVEAMRSGAYDYVLKPFKLSSMLPVLRRGLEMRTLRIENRDLERRLRERADELEAANRELDAFTRSASHDLRAPLGSMLGLCMLLKMDLGSTISERVALRLAQMEGEGLRMQTLLDDLMRLSRMGRQQLNFQDVDMTALAREVVGELRNREPDRALVVRVAPMPTARADASLVRQVFMNLLSNALKFTRGRTPAIVEIDCHVHSGTAVYSVRDNGTGFDMASADKMFEAFHRLHRQEQFEGSGVGLSIVQRVVERHGGRVWADAIVDNGACFRFTLAHATRFDDIQALNFNDRPYRSLEP